MKIVKLLLALAVAGFAYQYWGKHPQRGEQAGSTSVAESHNGFTPLPAITVASPAAVLVYAAEGCPEEAAQRADYLAEQLAQAGIPVSRLHSVNFDIPNGDASVVAQVMSMMNSPLPIVFVRGKAKSNPRLEEVVFEYKTTSR